MPESFRAPLVLCYLEGLTQEQAAARLQAPLGTIQSRLAGGRAKLKARLEQRGVDASAAIPGAGSTVVQPPSAPVAWVDTTVRMAVQYSHETTTSTVAGMAVTLAEELLRVMLIAKLRVAAGMILLIAVLVTGVSAWARQEANKDLNSSVTIKAAPPVTKPQPAPLPIPEPGRFVKRTVHGIVRDEQGRPVAKAWVGEGLDPIPDWSLITSPDRIRVATEPYRDQKGNPIPPGSLGTYFEYRDDSNQWRSIHPDDVRRYDRQRSRDTDLYPGQQAALEKALPLGLLEVRLEKGRRRMVPLHPFEERSAAQTDFQGQFAVEVSFFPHSLGWTFFHIASEDLLHEAVQVVRIDAPDRPVEITLKPTRLVRARVVETPKEHPEMPPGCRVYSNLSKGPRATGIPWGGDVLSIEGSPSSSGERRLEVRLPAGRYQASFMSPTTNRVVDLLVPAGECPVELPEIRLETLAWVKMLGQPTMEIEASDLEGKPAKLADHRGKVVLLAFWGSQDDEWLERINRLAELHKRLKDQPLAILALHDASVTSTDAFKKVSQPLLDRYFKPLDSPFRLLLDRAPTGEGTGPYGQQAREPRAGRTSDRYEVDVFRRTTFVIDKEGRLAFAQLEDARGRETFAMGKDGKLVWESDPNDFMGPPDDNSPIGPPDDQAANAMATSELLNALEDQLGLPRTLRPKFLRMPKPEDLDRKPPFWVVPMILMSVGVGLDDGPVAGARVSSQAIGPARAVDFDDDGLKVQPSTQCPHGLSQPWQSGSRRSASDGPQVPGS